MIDRSKRITLKKMALGAGAMGAGLTGTGAFGAGMETSGAAFADLLEQRAAETPELGNIEVTTRVSAINNDLEIVLTNAGQERVNITHMTPHTLRVPRGEFDFSSLLNRGPLTLEAGQSVPLPLKRVPLRLQQHRLPVHLTPTNQSLTDTLKKSMSVVTDTDAFASVTVPGIAAV